MKKTWIGENSMNLINEHDGFSVEEKKIIAWTKESGNVEFFGHDWKENVSSYFRKYEEKDNVMMFEFNNIAELKEQLESMWGQDEAMKKMATICSVATFRNRPQGIVGEDKNTKETGGGEETFFIPDFVYVF